MKRYMYIIAALLCCVMVGCMDSGRENTPAQPTLRMLTSSNTCFADGDKSSYLLLDGNAYGLGFTGRKLMRFDKQIKSMTRLCNIADCTHKTESCVTYIPETFTPVSVGCCDGEIYLFSEKTEKKDREIYLHRYKEDTLEKTVTKLDYAGNMYYPVFKDGNHIYYLYQQNTDGKGMQNCLVKTDIDTGAGQVVLAASPNYMLDIAGIDGNNIVLVEYTNLAVDEHKSTMFFYNTNSGNITVQENFLFRAERICVPVGQVFTFDYNSKTLYTYVNRTRKEVLKMQGGLAGYSILNMYGVFNGFAIAECYIENGGSTKLAINMDTGEYHEIVLKYKEYALDNYCTEVRPLGATEDGFIVVNGRSFYDITHIAKPSHGQALQKVDQLAYISANDFFNSRREYLQLN